MLLGNLEAVSAVTGWRQFQERLEADIFDYLPDFSIAGMANLERVMRDRNVTRVILLELPELKFHFNYVLEICDRVGILAKGVLVREGAVDDLLAIENQTDIVLENASPELLQEIEALTAKSGARLIEQGRSRTSLERLFLDATKSPKETTAGTLKLCHRAFSFWLSASTGHVHRAERLQALLSAFFRPPLIALDLHSQRPSRNFRS